MSGNTARRTSITYPNGRVVDLDYGAANSVEDSFGLVKSVAISGESGNKVDYARAGLARFVKVAYPQPNVEMSMIRPGGSGVGDAGDPYDGFDRFSRVQEMRWQNTSTGTPIDAWQWGFNEVSNRTWKKNLVAASGQDEAYGYDGLYQVIRDAVGTLNTNRTSIGGIPGEEEGFTYDPVGNWLAYRKDANGSPILDQTRLSNQDNQLTQIDGSGQGIEYDKVGNAVKIRPGINGDWTKHFTLVWDAWNRLVEVKDENGATVQKNAYDGLTRRITKESGGEVVHTYWSDRWKPLEERIDSATTAARSYLWGERPGHRDELVLRDRDTNGDGTLDERLYATMDYFNGTAIVDTSGTVLERYGYAAFGEQRVMGPDFGTITASDFDWCFGFQGQLRDGETGWYNYGYRFYVPLLGRWINRDPIRETGGVNVFNFSGNNGINDVDFLGFSPRNTGPIPSSSRIPNSGLPVGSPTRMPPLERPARECPLGAPSGVAGGLAGLADWLARATSKAAFRSFYQQALEQCEPEADPPDCGCCVITISGFYPPCGSLPIWAQGSGFYRRGDCGELKNEDRKAAEQHGTISSFHGGAGARQAKEVFYRPI